MISGPRAPVIQLKKRRSIRLRYHDYASPGAYFITICTYNRQCWFGDIANGTMQLNDTGLIIADEWIKTAKIRNEIELDAWVVMPNHFHGILLITDPVGATGRSPLRQIARTGDQEIARTGDRPVAPTGPAPYSLGAVMAGFKSAVTKRVNTIRCTPGAKLWQRNYWERVIRDEPELDRIREYIHNNPAQWEMDSLHPDYQP